MKKFLALIIILFTFSTAYAEPMSLNEKIGQLFIIRPDQLDPSLTPEQVHDSKADGVKFFTPEMLKTLKIFPAGGFVIFRKNIASPEQLKKYTSDLRKASRLYPIMAIDEEGGKISRIANHKAFNVKKFASPEAIAKSGKIRQSAGYIASYLKDYGFNLDFAPLADINTNPGNIVIGDRAFSSDPSAVSKADSEFLDGLHEHNIMGCLKHFPGHGDVTGDTHDDYVSNGKTWDELLKAEIVPYIDNLNKADTIMTAHITMKNITSDNLPASLSHEIVTEKLRNELGYKGVIITDAFNMGAVAKNYASSEAAILAIEAGNDIILMPYDYKEAFNGVLEAVKSGRITESRIDESVMRILKLKQKMQGKKINR